MRYPVNAIEAFQFYFEQRVGYGSAMTSISTSILVASRRGTPPSAPLNNSGRKTYHMAVSILPNSGPMSGVAFCTKCHSCWSYLCTLAYTASICWHDTHSIIFTASGQTKTSFLTNHLVPLLCQQPPPNYHPLVTTTIPMERKNYCAYRTLNL